MADDVEMKDVARDAGACRAGHSERAGRRNAPSRLPRAGAGAGAELVFPSADAPVAPPRSDAAAASSSSAALAGGAAVDGDGKPAGEVEEEEPPTGCRLVLYWINRFRARIFRLFDDPTSSKLAFLIAIYILLLIFMSTITFCIESLPIFQEGEWVIWKVLEAIAIANFSAEYVIRLLCAPHTWRFVKGGMNIVDLVAILPFYLELAWALESTGLDISGLAVIRVVRLTRVFRLFKLSKYSTGFTLVTRTLMQSGDAMGLLVFLIGLAMVFFSSAMYFAEQFGSYWYTDAERSGWVYRPEVCGSDDVDACWSNYQSIPHTFWWCIVTMTTVGYGDMYPITVQGKLVGVFAMLSGILILAFPITIIGANFADVWEDDKRTQRRAKVAAQVQQEDKEAAKADQAAGKAGEGGEAGEVSDAGAVAAAAAAAAAGKPQPVVSIAGLLETAIEENEMLSMQIAKLDDAVRASRRKQLATYKLLVRLTAMIEKEEAEKEAARLAEETAAKAAAAAGGSARKTAAPAGTAAAAPAASTGGGADGGGGGGASAPASVTPVRGLEGAELVVP